MVPVLVTRVQKKTKSPSLKSLFLISRQFCWNIFAELRCMFFPYTTLYTSITKPEQSAPVLLCPP